MVRSYTGPKNNACTELLEGCSQVEAGVVTNNFTKSLHQITQKHCFWAQYQVRVKKSCLLLLQPAVPLWRSHHSMLAAFAAAVLRNPKGGRSVIGIQKAAVALASLLHLGIILK